MIDNPQYLVKNIYGKLNKFTALDFLDAIFVPFRNRYDNVNALLGELKWFQGPIYLLPSNTNEINLVNRNINYSVLSFKEPHFIDFFSNLLTSIQYNSFYNHFTWDLPAKRNYALVFSRKYGYKRILLLDDDIRGMCPDVVNKGIYSLSKYVMSGCFVENFPDTSIFGHLRIIAGEQEYPFLSGSFLFLKPFEVHGFFPSIYNEDWLFMLPHILEKSICSYGSIAQLPYDPFEDPKKATFQEFGEIIAECLYELVSIKKYELRYEPKIWENEILKRRQALISLRKRLSNIKYQEIIDIALKANMKITPKDCLIFIKNWENDLVMWRRFLMEI
jgi:hypothetical protein